MCTVVTCVEELVRLSVCPNPQPQLPESSATVHAFWRLPQFPLCPCNGESMLSFAIQSSSTMNASSLLQSPASLLPRFCPTRSGSRWPGAQPCTLRAQVLEGVDGALSAVHSPPLTAVNQYRREGSFERPMVERQASKPDRQQPDTADLLPPWEAGSGAADALVVGCGPAGLALAAELAKQGLAVVLVGLDKPFTNNYGVWEDQFVELGLQETLDRTWSDAVCYFGEDQKVAVGRPYSRVCRRRLRSLLLERCAQAGVRYRAGEVVNSEVEKGQGASRVVLADGAVLRTRLVVLAAGAAAGKFLQYEASAPSVAVQTAYGMECEVEGFREAYEADAMLFMDFRRHHTGLWLDAAKRESESEAGRAEQGRARSREALWGTSRETPSFLYAMPLGPNRVFVEETCLVARPALPFKTLQRRLHRRLENMGVKVTCIIDEEWSYVPVGGPLPLSEQPLTAFGAAANLVHPATGYSIARSLREAPALARQVAEAVWQQPDVPSTSAAVWEALWPAEKRRQRTEDLPPVPTHAAFHVFGMELLLSLDLAATNSFFLAFFRLPTPFWRGFLASSLSSAELLAFAALVFALAPTLIRQRLVGHMVRDPAGAYLAKHYASALLPPGRKRNDSRAEGAPATSTDQATTERRAAQVSSAVPP